MDVWSVDRLELGVLLVEPDLSSPKLLAKSNQILRAFLSRKTKKINITSPCSEFKMQKRYSKIFRVSFEVTITPNPKIQASPKRKNMQTAIRNWYQDLV